MLSSRQTETEQLLTARECFDCLSSRLDLINASPNHRRVRRVINSIQHMANQDCKPADFLFEFASSQPMSVFRSRSSRRKSSTQVKQSPHLSIYGCFAIRWVKKALFPEKTALNMTLSDVYHQRGIIKYRLPTLISGNARAQNTLNQMLINYGESLAFKIDRTALNSVLMEDAIDFMIVLEGCELLTRSDMKSYVRDIVIESQQKLMRLVSSSLDSQGIESDSAAGAGTLVEVPMLSKESHHASSGYHMFHSGLMNDNSKREKKSSQQLIPADSNFVFSPFRAPHYNDTDQRSSEHSQQANHLWRW